MVQIKLPPLRERKSDIPLLVNSFLEKFSDPSGRIRTISEDAMARLIAYDWPGNVRELENAIERAVALGSGPILHVGDLPSNLHYAAGDRVPQSDELVPLEELERRAILRALARSRRRQAGRRAPAGHRQDHALPQAQAVRNTIARTSQLTRGNSSCLHRWRPCEPARQSNRFLDRDAFVSIRIEVGSYASGEFSSFPPIR